MNDDLAASAPLLTLEQIHSWPEWSQYVAEPAAPLFNALCLRATAAGEGRVAEAIEGALATLHSWKAAQHLSLMHHRNRRLTEAWYFAHLAADWSGDDVRALIALAQVLEKRQLPSAVSPLLSRIASALEALPPAGRAPFQQFVNEAHARLARKLPSNEASQVDPGPLPVGRATDRAAPPAEGEGPRSSWLFCGTLHAPGLTFTEPLCVGRFELTRRPEAHAPREAALAASLASQGLTASAGLCARGASSSARRSLGCPTAWL